MTQGSERTGSSLSTQDFEWGESWRSSVGEFLSGELPKNGQEFVLGEALLASSRRVFHPDPRTLDELCRRFLGAPNVFAGLIASWGDPH